MTRPALPVFVVGAHTVDLRGVRVAIDLLGLEPPPVSAADPDLEAALLAFRYRHDLISAEDCHRWLAARGLVYADLRASLNRRCQGIVARDPGEQDIDLLLAEAWPALASAVAARLAVAVEQGVAPERPIDWIALDDAFRGWLDSQRNAASRTRLLAQTRMQRLRVVLEVIELDSAGAAWEAHWCAVRDGESLAAIAADAGLAHRDGTHFLHELPATLAAELVRLAPGRTCEPVADAGRWLLATLGRVIEPELSDPLVAAGIDRQLDAIATEQLLARQVRWLI